MRLQEIMKPKEYRQKSISHRYRSPDSRIKKKLNKSVQEKEDDEHFNFSKIQENLKIDLVPILGILSEKNYK